MNRRSLLAALAAGTLALGCASAPVPTDYATEKPVLALEKYFNGELVAHGIFTDRGGKVVRRFTVKMTGTWSGNQGTLDERFTYSDGKTVNWNEKATPGKAEPEHPAPTLHLKPAGGGDHDGPAAGPSAKAPAPATPAWPGLTALAVSVVALLLGIANLAMSRRKN